MIRLSAKNVSTCYFLDRKRLRGIVDFVLRAVGVDDAEVSIVFVSDSDIRRLNLLYRRSNSPTDVLAFSMREGKRLKKDSSVLGDIVISVDRAKKHAARFGSSFKREVSLYIIHGLLHLVGYDDEDRASKKRMRRKEEEILERLWERKAW